jgi:hypothetical protein
MSGKVDERNEKATGKGLSRRRILSRIGATGLLASAGVFAGALKPEAAYAGPACCNLAHYPANATYSYCRAHASYIWYCEQSGGVHCSCCETAGNRYSAADCRYN